MERKEIKLPWGRSQLWILDGAVVSPEDLLAAQFARWVEREQERLYGRVVKSVLYLGKQTELVRSAG